MCNLVVVCVFSGLFSLLGPESLDFLVSTQVSRLFAL